MAQEVSEITETDAIIEKYGSDKSCLIQIMLEIQRKKRWLSEEDLRTVSQSLNVPPAQVYHIATFYKAFSLVPKGEHSISVCLGTACQVRNAPLLLDRVVEVFKVKPGQTSADLRFSLDTVNCLGCCALGPVLMIDDQYYSKPSKEELERLAAAE
jgi:NADH-quinone oxidoreductase subunit E